MKKILTTVLTGKMASGEGGSGPLRPLSLCCPDPGKPPVTPKSTLEQPKAPETQLSLRQKPGNCILHN